MLGLVGKRTKLLDDPLLFVAQRDEYGNPKWDTLQRVAHAEFSRKRVTEAAAGAELEKAFTKFEVFP